MKPKWDIFSLLSTGMVGGFIGSIFGCLFYGVFSALFFKADIALQNWMFPHPRDSLGVPWALTILSAIIFALLGFALAILNRLKRTKTQNR